MSNRKFAQYRLHGVFELVTSGAIHLIRQLDQHLIHLQKNAHVPALHITDAKNIEDYLAFRPTAFEAITAALQANQLRIGVWYVTPDLGFVHPEALLRNLQLGRGVIDAFEGSPLRVADHPQWGELESLPGILRGFGVEGLCGQWGSFPHPVSEWYGIDGLSITLVNTHPATEFGEYQNVLVRRPYSDPLDAQADLIPTTPSEQFMYSDLEGYFLTLSGLTPPHVHGDLRTSQAEPLGINRLSSAIPLTHASRAAEQALIRWAEPFTAWANQLNDPLNPHYALTTAWRTLCATQGSHSQCEIPHFDAVTPEITRERFAQTHRLSEQLIDAALTQLAHRIPATSEQIIVFNPSDVPRTEVVALDGLCALAKDVPQRGYGVYALAPSTASIPTPTGDLKIENEFLSVQLDPAGPTLTIHDKHRNLTYFRQAILWLEGDQGDVTHFAPIGRAIQMGRNLHTQGLSGEYTPIYQTLNYSVMLTLDPAPEMTPPDRPSGQHTHLYQVDIALKLTPGNPRLDFKITLHNTLANHRVRLHFPLPFTPEKSYHEGAFHLKAYPIEDLPPISPPEGWVETPSSIRPTGAFGALFNPTAPYEGLVIANRGLPEYEVVINEEGGWDWAITLLRSVSVVERESVITRQGASGFTGMNIGMPCDPLLGVHTAELSVILSDFSSRIVSYQHGWAFAEGDLRAIRTHPTMQGESLRNSFLLTSEPRFKLTAIKLPADDSRGGLIIRGYNWADTDVKVTITPFRRYAQVEVTRMDETPTGGRLAVLPDGSFEFYAAPNRILTFWIHD
jgi:hypothetical protein